MLVYIEYDVFVFCIYYVKNIIPWVNIKMVSWLEDFSFDSILPSAYSNTQCNCFNYLFFQSQFVAPEIPYSAKYKMFVLQIFIYGYISILKLPTRNFV